MSCFGRFAAYDLGHLLLFTVGASLLAKNINDNAGILDERGVLEFFASELAPTG